MAELNPCPFCGGEANLDAQFGRQWWVQCSNVDCNATSSAIEPTPQAAAEWWNRRATDGVRVPAPRSLTEGEEAQEFMRWNLSGNDAALAFHDLDTNKKVRQAFVDGLRRGLVLARTMKE